MDQNQFFGTRQPIRLDELAERIGATLSKPESGERMVETVAPLYRAGAYDVCYIVSKNNVSQLETCHAAAVICSPGLKKYIPSELPALVSDKPQLAFAHAAAHLYPKATRPQSVLGKLTGISPQAHVDATAVIEKSVEIEPFAVVGARAVIGAGTRILSGAVVGSDVKIGRNVTLGAHVSVTCALIGNNVIIHTGARIGQDGFGYAPGPTGMVKLPQVGRVIIQDDVEIGANSTVDRGAMDDTIIGEGTKIDNLVQIGHNVQIGRHCGIVSQAGVAGSTKVGDGVMIGGQTGINGHIEIGTGAQIAGKSGVLTSVPAGARIGGNPSRPIREYLKDAAEIARQSAKSGDKKGE